MSKKTQREAFTSHFSSEITEFINFKRQSGIGYTSTEFVLKAFDRFCSAANNQALTPQQLAEEWIKPDDDRPKYDGGHSVRQLGQYLTEIGHLWAS